MGASTQSAVQVSVVGDEAALQAVRAALGDGALVEAGEGPAGQRELVVVSAAQVRDAGGPEAWLAGRDERQGGPSLVLLAPLAEQPLVERWLAAGGHDWVFEEQPGLLRAVLARQRRDRRAREAREQLEVRLRASTSELVRLARSPRFRGDDLDAALKEVTETAVRALAVGRCGVWLLDDPHSTLRQVAQYDARTGEHGSGRAIAVGAHRAYFSTLVSQRLISASDARGDPRTAEFNEEYHLPQDISSVIDVGVRLRGELVGVLCLEHVGPARRWTASEEAFASALADVVSLALEGAERYRVESALLQSERRFRDLFLHTSDATVLYRVSADGTVYLEDLNPAAEAAWGLDRDDVIGRQAREVLGVASASRLQNRFAQALLANAPVLFEDSLELPTGVRWFNTALVPLVDEAGRVTRLAAIARDVTLTRESESLQRRLEGQLAEAQKNEALARLASHIAHDVNNLLTVVVAHAQRLQPMTGRAAEVAEAILQATHRGRELTQQVLTFGRRRPPERTALDLGPVVHETVKLLEVTAPGVAMRVEVPALPVTVQADPGQLHQVVTNLCTNALNAMAGVAEAALTVRLELVDVDHTFAQQHPPLQAGRWARLSVTDSGEGMDDATRQRIFEPFFSTRPVGRGTGLGLAVVQSIVQGHDGAVVVDSRPGEGSTFSVYLPAVEQTPARPGAGQHLMLVDDHPGMARVSARLLETLGYRTSVFDDPRDALAAFRQAPASFDAIVTDLSMPQMSGQEFTRSVRALAPRVPVIVSSGLATELDGAALEELGVAAVLIKPWRLEEAVAALQRVLPAP